MIAWSISMTKISRFRKCDFCNQELKAYKVLDKIRHGKHKGKLVEGYQYNHKNSNYKHVTPFGTFKCYNKRKADITVTNK